MKILLALDGSAPSQDAIREIAHRPWPTPSTVRIVSVVQPYVPSAPDDVLASATINDLRQRQIAEAQELATGAGEQIAGPGLSVETSVREGDPRTEIVGAADDWNADLIVVGSHGRTGLKRLLLGSVAEAVVAHAHCSVEVVRRHDQAPA